MKEKNLFILHAIEIEITNDTLWADQYPIVEMDDDHVRNALLYCQTRASAEKAAGLNPIKKFGYTYTEWVEIFKAEEFCRAKNKWEELKQQQVHLEKILKMKKS